MHVGNFLSAHLSRLRDKSYSVHVVLKTMLISKGLRRHPRDLSDRVAPPFFPFVEAGVLAPWFTSGHRLVLSGPLRVNVPMSFETSPCDGTISTVAMVGACDRLQADLTALSVSIQDKTGSTLARAPLKAEPIAGSHLLVGSFQPLTTNPHTTLFVNVHLDDIAGADWRIYEWRRHGLTRHSDHRAFFGVLA